MSYAIPTKDAKLRTLPLPEINSYVAMFLEYATHHPDLIFLVTRIGCGLAGYRNTNIAPMFKYATPNCVLPNEWLRWWMGCYFQE